MALRAFSAQSWLSACSMFAAVESRLSRVSRAEDVLESRIIDMAGVGLRGAARHVLTHHIAPSECIVHSVKKEIPRLLWRLRRRLQHPRQLLHECQWC
jgi:hypothetical protein